MNAKKKPIKDVTIKVENISMALKLDLASISLDFCHDGLAY